MTILRCCNQATNLKLRYAQYRLCAEGYSVCEEERNAAQGINPNDLIELNLPNIRSA